MALGKKKSLKSRKTSTAIVSVSAALMIALLTGLVLSAQNDTITVPISTQPIYKGEEITPDKVSYIDIGRAGIPVNLATTEAQVIGKYAVRDYGVGEYFFGTSLTTDYYKRLSEKAKYGAIAVSTNTIKAVTSDIRENDFVKVLLVMQKDNNSEEVEINNALETNDAEVSKSTAKFTNSKSVIVSPKDLSAVRVLGVYSGDAKSIEWAKDKLNQTTPDKLKETEAANASIVVFDAKPVQQALLASIEYGGTMHMVILPEEVQEEYREAWGLNKDKTEAKEVHSEGTFKMTINGKEVINETVKDGKEVVTKDEE